MENQPTINLEFNGLKVKLVHAGTFEDETGARKAYPDSIKLQLPGEDYAKKILPSQLAGLVQACADPEIKKELTRRLENEKKVMQGVTF